MEPNNNLRQSNTPAWKHYLRVTNQRSSNIISASNHLLKTSSLPETFPPELRQPAFLPSIWWSNPETCPAYNRVWTSDKRIEFAVQQTRAVGESNRLFVPQIFLQIPVPLFCHFTSLIQMLVLCFVSSSRKGNIEKWLRATPKSRIQTARADGTFGISLLGISETAQVSKRRKKGLKTVAQLGPSKVWILKYITEQGVLHQVHTF